MAIRSEQKTIKEIEAQIKVLNQQKKELQELTEQYFKLTKKISSALHHAEKPRILFENIIATILEKEIYPTTDKERQKAIKHFYKNEMLFSDAIQQRHSRDYEYYDLTFILEFAFKIKNLDNDEALQAITYSAYLPENINNSWFCPRLIGLFNELEYYKNNSTSSSHYYRTYGHLPLAQRPPHLSNIIREISEMSKSLTDIFLEILNIKHSHIRTPKLTKQEKINRNVIIKVYRHYFYLSVGKHRIYEPYADLLEKQKQYKRRYEIKIDETKYYAFMGKKERERELKIAKQPLTEDEKKTLYEFEHQPRIKYPTIEDLELVNMIWQYTDKLYQPHHSL
ncbi:MAG: hypothetical protein LBQ18_00155 [Campylobacteraceae bacterium]|jgi:hypothetical protein|nr:hypothetical protein [Campylobacteraceae bacterium]